MSLMHSSIITRSRPVPFHGEPPFSSVLITLRDSPVSFSCFMYQSVGRCVGIYGVSNSVFDMCTLGCTFKLSTVSTNVLF